MNIKLKCEYNILTDRQGFSPKKKGGKSYLNSSLLLTSERRLNARGDINE